MDLLLESTLQEVARFYDERKVGDVGPLGFRRSTDLGTLLAGLDRLVSQEIIVPGKTLFMDLGCSDGRVNVFLSYLARVAVGRELDEWTLDEYDPLRVELEGHLSRHGLLLPPDNIFLFQGDATDEGVFERIGRSTGFSLGQFDLFYTYLVMHEELADLIVRRGKPGAIFLIYGLQKVMPRYNGLRLLNHLSPLEGILGIYKKP